MMQQRQQAFTLIELMVVMAIMTVMFSLIGPLAQNQVDKVRASEEWYSFSQHCQSLSATAFFRGIPVELRLKGREAVTYIGGQLSDRIVYQQLMFAEQTVTFSSNGYPGRVQINARVRSTEKVLTLTRQEEKIVGAN